MAYMLTVGTVYSAGRPSGAEHSPLTKQLVLELPECYPDPEDGF